MKTFLKYVVAGICVLAFLPLSAQKRSFSECEMRLNMLFSHLKKDTVAENKRCINDSIYDVFSEILQHEVSLEYDFKNTAGLKKVVSSDKHIAVYSWCYVVDGERLAFNGVVQRRAKGMEVYPLKSQLEAYVPTDNQVIDAENWYGALYFDIFPFRSKQGKTYVLLGWSQNNRYLTMKTIDVLWFDNGKLRFGLPVFEMLKNEFLARVVFQYNSEVSMTLLYEPQNRRFVFDHLAPVNSGFVGDYRYYAPDSSYDAYKKKTLQRKWVFYKNVDVDNN